MTSSVAPRNDPAPLNKKEFKGAKHENVVSTPLKELVQLRQVLEKAQVQIEDLFIQRDKRKMTLRCELERLRDQLKAEFEQTLTQRRDD